jgi:hypothetical protein
MNQPGCQLGENSFNIAVSNSSFDIGPNHGLDSRKPVSSRFAM